MNRSLLFALLLATTACSSLQTEGDYMVLRNEGADLPVWVRGDVESGTFIVWLGGGPGDPVEVMRGEGTDALEIDHAVVYWDQRGCGSAGGNPAPETFTMDQFVEDTDQVVELVRQRYDAESIFLLGHSWGGTLGTAYLLDEARQAKISGFVDLAGNHDFPLVFPMKLAWLANYADAEIAAGRRVEHWRAVASWARSNPPFTLEEYARWMEHVDETNAAFFDGDEDFVIDFDLLFRSGQSPLAYLLVNRDYVEESLFHADEVQQSLSYSSRMHAITLPVLTLWGREDGIVPRPVADAAHTSLGTPDPDRHAVVIDNAAHFPFLEQPRAFATAVNDFVDAYR